MVNMTRHIQSTKITGQFYVGVVTHEHLADYLEQRVNVVGRRVKALAEANPHRFVTRLTIPSIRDRDFDFGSPGIEANVPTNASRWQRRSAQDR